MFEEKGGQQCPLFLKAFGCDGVMVNQVALLTLDKILAQANNFSFHHFFSRGWVVERRLEMKSLVPFQTLGAMPKHVYITKLPRNRICR